jgi:hypothetical protein
MIPLRKAGGLVRAEEPGIFKVNLKFGGIPHLRLD